MEELVERRKHKRFRVRHGGFASLHPHITVVGQIIDIGTGGLAFRYVASENRTNGSATLNILLTDGSFSLETIPFQTVWDSGTPGDFSLGAITLRHCGVQFGELTHGQKLDLEYFIRFYTLEGVRMSHGSRLQGESKIARRQACSYA